MPFTVIHPNGAPDSLDEVEMAFVDRLDPGHHAEPPSAPRQAATHQQPVVGGVAHAFRLDLEHPPVMLEGLFAASEMFDFHEVAAESRHLIVDVLEVTPTRTTLHVKPEHAMTYSAIAREVALMVDDVGSRVFGGQLRLSRLEWIVETVGVPSAGRSPAPELALC